METIIQLLYDIPILGIVFQLVGYLVAVLPDIAPIILRSAVPIAFAALCGVMCERGGVVNIGIEGTMLTAAFVGWAAGVFLIRVVPYGEVQLGLFGATPVLVMAFGLAVLSGVLVALLHAWLSISVRADQIIAGTIINIAAFGVTGYLITLVARTAPVGAGSFGQLRLPRDVTELPLVGWLIETVLAQGPITISLLITVILFQVFLFRSRWGLRTRAVGENPRAAEAVGVDVIRLRYKNVLMGGVLAALGGAFLTIELTGLFQQGITTGRGFIGLAAMIVGRWTPLGAFGAALLFASSGAIGQSVRIRPPTDELGQLLGSIPGQVFDALPYLVTIVILAGLVGRSVPPAADGVPYEREGAK